MLLVPPVAEKLLVPMPARPDPDPLKVVPLTVPVMLAPPAETVRPPAVIVSPPLLIVGEVRLGDPASTTLPLPVDAVVHCIPVLPVAVQKSGLVKVPKLMGELDPIRIHEVPLQYCNVWEAEL